MRKYIYITVGFLVAIAIIVPSAMAVSSRFSQEILPINCILTVVGTPNGPQVVGECPNSEPQVTEVETTASGERFIRGIYDARNTAILRLIFRGVTYTANTPGSPMTITGDSWKFAINEVVPTVESGNYTVILQATMNDGTILTTTTNITLSPQVAGQPDPGFELLPPGVPATNGWSLLYGIAASPLKNNLQNPPDLTLSGYGNALPFYDNGNGPSRLLRNELSNVLNIIIFLVIILVIGFAKFAWLRRSN